MAEFGNTDLTINVNVSTNITVDQRAVNLCLQLLNIYGLQDGLTGMVLKFDEGINTPFVMPVVRETLTKEGIERAMDAISFEILED